MRLLKLCKVILVTTTIITVSLPFASQGVLPSKVEANTEAVGRCGDPAQRPWCNTSLSPDERAELLLKELTKEEKISLLAGDEIFGVGGAEGKHTGTSNGISRVGLPTMYYADGPVGPRQGKATALPAPMGLAATFDRQLSFSHGTVVANEVKNKGNDVVFAPTVNIMRTPLGGRTFEAFGEDPYLVTRMGVNWINGAQSEGVIANVKHYAMNNQEGIGRPEAHRGGVVGSRMTVNVNADERTQREIYLPHFEAAVKEANVGTVMCAYNRVGGQYSCENNRLLNDILKKEWGFKGFVLSDYLAAKNPIASLKNGLDFEPWPGVVYGEEAVTAAVESGQVTMAQIDEHIFRILRTMFAYGMFDRPPYKDDDSQIDKKAHALTAQQIEESAITLLKNENILPLDDKKVKSIAIVGAVADKYRSGGGSSNVTPFSYTTPLQAITERAGSNIQVHYDNGSDISRASNVAKDADVAIVFATDNMTQGNDRACLSLDCPGDKLSLTSQDEMISKVAEANPNTIVVLETGGPVLTPWRDKIKGLFEAWYPGQEGGTAIARVLFGDVDPGGRLPVTFPQKEADLPTAGDLEKYPGVGEEVYYKEGVFVGYRWFDSKNIEPAFEFGSGMSYTTFSYSNLRIKRANKDSGAKLNVIVKVTNTGNRTGVAVPQLYLGLPSPNPSVPQPPKQLKGFQKLSLPPGESAEFTLPLDDRAFSYWDVNSNGWRVADGDYKLMVGSSSRDILLNGTISILNNNIQKASINSSSNSEETSALPEDIDSSIIGLIIGER
ncbi:beta-glucosidase [Bacillus sp. V2I10]|uniref:beta-glucosidase family protein n=1 Tax=Bacillus sp. V2I10 TaxID=3042276 RepID=UPI00277EE37F|nr:glycoside hydrolase family 3 C-terminal domain-containing protein [Bacillus sp. V2I10]MDQ0862059.1 beta-glucosidase [Bacillus sp. V2I10]